jgi:hypothetical protein
MAMTADSDPKIIPFGKYDPKRLTLEKPDEAYKRMQQLFPGPYLELFARKERQDLEDMGQRDRCPDHRRLIQ